MPRIPAHARFWSLVEKNGPVLRPSLGPCWVWFGPRLKRGYGKFGTYGLAHRYSWRMHKRESPAGLEVLHHCDNPSCVNPGHLFLGTQQDNLADMRDKGRQVRGEQQGSAKTTEDVVKEIRRRYKRYSHTDGSGALAKEFGLCPTQVWRIATREHWKHV